MFFHQLYLQYAEQIEFNLFSILFSSSSQVGGTRKSGCAREFLTHHCSTYAEKRSNLSVDSEYLLWQVPILSVVDRPFELASNTLQELVEDYSTVY